MLKTTIRVAALALCAWPVAAGPNTSEPPVRFSEAADIARNLTDAAVLDLRPFGEYLRGHVPGAVHLDDECIRGPVSGLPVQYCDPQRLAQLFGAAGVSLERPVVVYSSQSDPLAATMAAYALARVGHADVTILSGGFGAWAANHQTSKTFPQIEPVEFAPAPPTLDAVKYDEFAESVGFNDRVFIDARPAIQHRGDAPIWPRNGHIPGAHSLDWTRLTEPDNKHRLKPKKQIEAILEDLGVSAWDDVVVYCGTGREATLLMIALACELGWKGVKLYEGSWTEYSAIADAQVAVGPRAEPKTRVYSDGRMSISGQPTEDTLRWLADQGVGAVISCRTDIEMGRLDFDQSELLDELGLEYVHIPMGGHFGYEPGQVDQLARVLTEHDGKVLLHCASGGRARLLFMAHLVENEGVHPDQAWERSLQFGGQPWSFSRLLDERVRLLETGAGDQTGQ